MSTSSRPDIQVLENRIARLKSQILEYTEVRLYKTTKRKLADLSGELYECAQILDSIVGESCNDIPVSSLSAVSDDDCDGPLEFSSDSDLLDLFHPADKDATNKDAPQSTKPCKEIVNNYSVRLQDCADTLGISSGILQVNQFCSLLNSWYQKRFGPANRNPEFFFKATRIPEWVDLLILSAGRAINEGTFSSFVQEMTSWIADLNTPRDKLYVLPYSVIKMRTADSDVCTQEAVLIEKIVKPSIYDENFYPDKLDSVYQLVVNNSKYTADDLTINQIIQDCPSPRLIVTSSFDATKYGEGC
jgi:hypothetical protein